MRTNRYADREELRRFYISPDGTLCSVSSEFGISMTHPGLFAYELSTHHRDSKQVEVFEGDVVDGPYLGRVHWSQKNSMFEFVFTSKPPGPPLQEIALDKCTVICSIHDDPSKIEGLTDEQREAIVKLKVASK